MMPTTNEISSPDPKMIPTEVRVERGAREDLEAGTEGFPQLVGGVIGVDSGLQSDRGEIDDIEAPLRKEPGKIGGAHQYDPETHEPCAQHVLPADRNFSITDFNHSAGVER